MSRRPTPPIATAVIAACVLALSVPAIALAQTDREPATGDSVLTDEAQMDHLERAKARVIKQIERRLETLDRLSSRIEAATHVTAVHADSLLADIAAADAVLEGGIPVVAAVETPEQLREVGAPIFENTLVFALLTPKSHEVVASGAVVAATERFTEYGAKIQEALDRLVDTDIDRTGAQANLDEMLRLLDEAAAAAGPVAETVISLQPTDWPEPAQSTLREGKETLRNARNSLRKSRALAREVVAFVRSAGAASDG